MKNSERSFGKIFFITGVSVLSLILSYNCSAQEKTYFDSPFGLGGGFIASWTFPNIQPVNDQLKAFGTPELAKSGYFSSGGAGFVYIGFVPGLRIGGIGFSGSTKESKLSDGFRREAKLTSSFGGVSLEYTLPFIRSVGVSVGVILGGGNTTLEFYRYKDSYSWDHLWNEITNDSTSSINFGRKLSNDYFVVAPTLNLDIPIYRLAAFRLGATYAVHVGDNW
ncbi:MAG: hypothetical protein WC557_08505, partial [Ignavibacteriaceae bacterium]